MIIINELVTYVIVLNLHFISRYYRGFGKGNAFWSIALPLGFQNGYFHMCKFVSKYVQIPR